MGFVYCKICKNKFETKTNGTYCSDDCKKVGKSIRNKKYHSKNSEKAKLIKKEHYQNNKEYYSKRDKLKREKHKENHSYKWINKKFPLLGEKELENKRREIKNEQRKDRYKVDKLYAIQSRFRGLLNKYLRESTYEKDYKTLEYLGCDWETFINHLESFFDENLNWDNKAEWHIDHKIPISSAKNKYEIIALNYYRNLQPLRVKENIKKSDNYDTKEKEKYLEWYSKNVKPLK